MRFFDFLIAVTPVERRLLPEATVDRMLAAIQAKPGITPGELTRRAEVSAGTVYYHLRHLEGTGTIHTVVSGRRRLVFLGPRPPEGLVHAEKLSMLRGRTANRIASMIDQEPGLSIVDLVVRVRESPRSVYYHVRRLKAAGLIWSSSVTRYRDLRPSPDLRSCLAAVDSRELLDE